MFRKLFGLGPRTPIDAKELAAKIEPERPYPVPVKPYVGPRRRIPLNELVDRRDRLKAVLAEWPAKVTRLESKGHAGQAGLMAEREIELRDRLLELEFEIARGVAKAQNLEEPTFELWREKKLAEG